MKLDKICRTCLLEKTNLKPLFEAYIPSMLMSFVSVQLIQDDGLPQQICTQCITNVNKAYAFKQLCEKSDLTLRNYLNINMPPITLQTDSIISDVHKTDLFNTSEVLQQSSLFQEILNEATSNSLVHNFTGPQSNTVVSDLAETMQSLQTIAEQCLPDSWDANNQYCTSGSNDSCNNFDLSGLYKCHFCEDLFKDEWSLGEHIKNHAGQNKYFCTDLSNEINKCILLEQTFDSTEINFHESSPNFFCSVCDRTFTEQKYLKKHLRDIHFINTDPSLEEKKYVCNICGKRYRQNKILMVHMKNHTGQRPLRCEVCSRTFALPSSLHKHRKIHQEKKYVCNICGKKFNQSSNLNCHILLHTGQKPYMCTICGKNFATNTNLEIHKRIHTGTKPHICSFCDKGFISSTQLKKHMMIHTGEKPYSCWQCGRSFRRKETRDTHVRYHTGERPYGCSVCNKKYIAASHLRVHMKSHNDDTKYDCIKTLEGQINSRTESRSCVCQFCGKCFAESGGLNAHIKDYHSQ